MFLAQSARPNAIDKHASAVSGRRWLVDSLDLHPGRFFRHAVSSNKIADQTASGRWRGLECREIYIAFSTAAVKGLLRGGREGLIQAQPLDEIGIGDEGAPERDHVRLPARDRLHCQFAVVTVVGDIGAAKCPAQSLKVELALCVVAARLAFDAMQVGEAQRTKPLSEKSVGYLRIAVERR